MALSPQEMNAAITRNLKEKTGKTMNEWVAIIQPSDLKEKKELIGFLKKEKNLGHFQAQMVFDYFKNTSE